ncbi:hypothetical protein [Pseudomonas sp. SWI44]|nr:hypothetical protein [Pseudomonas sp. SWI44]
MRHLFEADNGEIFEYSDEQLEAGYGASMRRLTDAEADQHLAVNSAEVAE